MLSLINIIFMTILSLKTIYIYILKLIMLLKPFTWLKFITTLNNKKHTNMYLIKCNQFSNTLYLIKIMYNNGLISFVVYMHINKNTIYANHFKNIKIYMHVWCHLIRNPIWKKILTVWTRKNSFTQTIILLMSHKIRHWLWYMN